MYKEEYLRLFFLYNNAWGMMFQTIIDEKQIVSVFLKIRAVDYIVNLQKERNPLSIYSSSTS